MKSVSAIIADRYNQGLAAAQEHAKHVEDPGPFGQGYREALAQILRRRLEKATR